MDIDAMVLRAMLRLARRLVAADEGALSARVGGPSSAIRDSLRRLDAAGLVERRGDKSPRLTMTGLAAAVALLPVPAARAVRRSARASRAA